MGLVLAVLAAGGAQASAGAPPRVLVAKLDDDINPVSQGYLQDQVRRAASGGYQALVVELDTPGGLGSSMRKIVKTFLASPVPVVVYVRSRLPVSGGGGGSLSNEQPFSHTSSPVHSPPGPPSVSQFRPSKCFSVAPSM